MREKTKKQLVWLAAFAMLFQVTAIKASSVFAFESGAVVINEVAWAGSAASSNDEWVELYNTSNQDIDLTDWVIEDDGASSYKIVEGTIPAHGYFLIEDREGATDVKAGALIGLSLANAGDSLVLKDIAGSVIDSVNSLGGAWYAGKADTKSSMERIDPTVQLDKAENWASALAGNGALAQDGSVILGTPGSVNSNYGGSGPVVSLKPESLVANFGEIVELEVLVEDAADLYAYGVELKYDPTVFHFRSAEEGALMGADGVVTAFNYGLKNGDEGTLIVGNARLINPSKGIDGSGELFSLSFEVISAESVNSQISFGPESYLADSNGDVPSKFEAVNIRLGAAASGPVKNLQAGPGAERYSIELNWGAPAEGADKYLVLKADTRGDFVLIGQPEEANFVDNATVQPGVSYGYKVIAIKDGINSAASTASATEDRGLKGDNDRNDKVDGRDIENLARAYGSEIGDEEYNPLVDTNFDGVIDGNDLIDIGVSFGLTYQ